MMRPQKFSPWVWLACMLALSCAGENKKGAFEFYYYPKVNMYYDVTSSQYLYSIDSAKTWTVITDTSQQGQASLGEKHVLYADRRDVWRDNEQHRNTYHGSILNIVSATNDLPADEGTVKERKALVKKPATKAAEEEKPKKGIGRFLQKIFGKKKDKQSS